MAEHKVRIRQVGNKKKADPGCLGGGLGGIKVYANDEIIFEDADKDTPLTIIAPAHTFGGPAVTPLPGSKLVTISVPEKGSATVEVLSTAPKSKKIRYSIFCETQGHFATGTHPSIIVDP